ncbi:signal peptidase II [Candidatus Peregrinibacteria bacterium]|nr:signal peptidase II [Candidatus Peregrinibacteria bacterium]
MKEKIASIFAIASLFALIDQLSKYLAVVVFNLPFTQNPGIAFSINLPRWYSIVFTLALICAIIYFAIKDLDLKNKLALFSVALIVGGALGNFIDRITKGSVTDFISISIWPKFNVADALITAGVLMLFIFHARIKKVNPSNVRKKS